MTFDRVARVKEHFVLILEKKNNTKIPKVLQFFFFFFLKNSINDRGSSVLSVHSAKTLSKPLYYFCVCTKAHMCPPSFVCPHDTGF